MNIGKLDERIVIQTPTTTKDSYGQPVEAWSDLATVWCQRIDVVRATKELERGEDIEALKYVSRFIIRYRSDVTGTERISCDGRVYNINQIATIGRREALEIVAVATENNDYA